MYAASAGESRILRGGAVSRPGAKYFKGRIIRGERVRGLGRRPRLRERAAITSHRVGGKDAGTAISKWGPGAPASQEEDR